jgi:Ca2+/Na+ antiporter
VGAGTVVGSELFNMLVIIGGVCIVTPKALILDWRPLSREVIFFALSLIGVLWVLVRAPGSNTPSSPSPPTRDAWSVG